MTQNLMIDTTKINTIGQDREILDWLKDHPPGAETLIDFHDNSIPGYRLIRELGSGAMSTVYLAEQITLKRLVAIKISRSTQRQAQEWKRFQREAEILSQLPHPGVLKVIDSGLLENQRPYFVTEWCPGGHLGQRLHGQPLTPRAAAAFVASVCDILEVVHQADIIHRDLKPSNILVMEKDELPLDRCTLRIADFGLARQITLDERATLTHTTMGTPGYSAPEQWNDAKLADHRSDIYSLGAMLYELLTGRPPFQAASPISAIKYILHEDPVKPRLLQPSIDASLEAVCLKCLEKSPRDRYTSAADLAADLRRFLNHEPVHARPPGPAKQASHWIRKHPVLSISSLAASVLLVLGLFSLWRVSLSEERSQAHEKLSKQAEYFRLLATIRARAIQPTQGWTYANLQDINKARALSEEKANDSELKHEFLRASLAFDLENIGIYQNQKLGVILSAVWHPFQPWLAIGYGKALENQTNIVEVIEVPSMKLLHYFEWKAETTGFGGDPRKNQDGIRSLAWNQDGTILLSGTRAGALQQFDFAFEPPSRKCLGHIPDSVHTLYYCYDGRYILANSSFAPFSKKLYRWNTQGGGPELLWDDQLPLSVIAPIPGTSQVAIVRQDGSFLGIDIGANTKGGITPVQDCPVTLGVGIDSYHGKFIRGFDLYLWNKENKMNLVPIRRSSLVNLNLILQTNSIAFEHLPLTERILGAGMNQGSLWLPHDKVFAYQRYEKPHVDFLEYASDARCLSTTLGNINQKGMYLDYQQKTRCLCTTSDDSVAFYQSKNVLIDFIDLHTESLIDFDMTHEGTQRLVFDGNLAISQSKTQRYSVEMSSLASPVFSNDSVAIAPSRRQFAVLHQNILKVGDLDLKKEVVFTNKEPRHNITFSSDGVLWITGRNQLESIDQNMNLKTNPIPEKDHKAMVVTDRWMLGLQQSGYDLDVFERVEATDLKLKKVWTFDEPVESLTLDPTQSLVAFGTRSGNVIVRQIPDGKVLFTLPACHRDIITSIDWKGNTIATGGQDHWIRVWEEHAGQWQPSLEWQARGEIVKLRLTSDTKQLVALIQDEYALRTFDLTSIRTLLQQHGWIK